MESVNTRRSHVEDRRQRTNYWMRAVSFAGLHRVLALVADYPRGLRATQINQLVNDYGVLLTRKNTIPSPTTLYHYRNTLLRLSALRRVDSRILVNEENPSVYQLLQEGSPRREDRSLSVAAKNYFASLVLDNVDCRSLFFDLFTIIDVNRGDPVVQFREAASPVTWSRRYGSGGPEVVFHSRATDCVSRCTSHGCVVAVLYGLRYWARDELSLIDEFIQPSDEAAIMFPLSASVPHIGNANSVLDTVRQLLLLRTSSDWTVFSVADLIVRCCVELGRPISTLFAAIDWLTTEWPGHTVLISTSRALATMRTTSSPRENMLLRRYYKQLNGPYISHIRLHNEISIPRHTEVCKNDT